MTNKTIGKVTTTIELTEHMVHLAVKASGEHVLIVGQKRIKLLENREEGAPLVATLFELVRQQEPAAELGDAGPGLYAYKARVDELFATGQTLSAQRDGLLDTVSSLTAEKITLETELIRARERIAEFEARDTTPPVGS